jgi:hypothetical protein
MKVKYKFVPINVSISLLVFIFLCSSSTQAIDASSNPTFTSVLRSGGIHGSGFSPNSELFVEIFTSYGGERLIDPISAATDETGFFEINSPQYYLIPGEYVSVSDLSTGITKTLVLDDITIEDVDPEIDKVVGTAPPLTTLSLYINESESFIWRTVDVNELGNWTYDFSLENIDLHDGQEIGIHLYEVGEFADGDSTSIVHPPSRPGWFCPFLGEGNIFGFDFYPNTLLNLEIFDPNGALVLAVSNFIQTNREGHFSISLDQIAPGYRFEPNSTVLIYDPVTGQLQEDTLRHLTIDGIDYEHDLIWGTGEPGFEVSLHNGTWVNIPSVVVPISDDGTWQVNYWDSYQLDIPPGFIPAVYIFEHGGGCTAIPEYLITVSIDIKPGDYPNCLNNDGHGVIPVAILSTPVFDATKVDPGSIQLDGMSVKIVGKGKLQSSFEDVNGDGLLDIIVKIQDSDGVYSQGNSVGVLTGATIDGVGIKGEDSICVVPYSPE